MDEGPDNLAMVAAQTIAHAEAMALQGVTVPHPPVGCQPLTSIRTVDEDPLETAIVLGYSVRREEVRDVFGPDFLLRQPGDPGYFDVAAARLTGRRIPKGWSVKTRVALVLYALIDGNPILLEEQARERGYRRALAVSPKWLQLGELPC